MGSIGSWLQRTISGHTGTPPNPPAPPPTVPEPIPMPDPDDPLLLARKRRTLTANYSSRGRASTIYSDIQGTVQTDPLGGK